MTEFEEPVSSSIADGLKSSTVESADDFELAQEEAKEAEKERLLSAQQRRDMLASLRSSLAQRQPTGLDRKVQQEHLVRLIRDGTAEQVDREMMQVLRFVRTLKHKRELSRAADSLAGALSDRAKVFVQKKTLLERVEKKVGHFRRSPSGDSTAEGPVHSVVANLGLDKIEIFVKSLSNDLVRIIEDLLTTYERLEDQIDSDAQEEDNTRSFFFACLSALDENLRKQVLTKCQATCRDAPREKRIAVYRTIVESLARTNEGVAERVHSVARKKAREYLNRQEPDKAVSELGAALRLWRDNPDTLRMLAAALSRKGDEHGALTALQEAARLCPDDLSLRKRVAQGWEKLRQEDRAIGIYEDILAQSPGEDTVARKCAELLFKREQYRRVTEVLAEYAHRFPEDLPCQSWLGVAWQQIGQPRKAIPLLARVVESGTEDKEACHLLVLAYRDAGLVDEAMKVLQDHLRSFPDCPKAHLFGGSLCLSQGDLKQAEIELRQTANSHGESYSLLLTLGRTQIEQGRFEEAARTLEQAIGADGTRPEAFLELGRAYRQVAEHERAIFALKRAIEIDEDNALARQELSMLYVETGQWDLAKEVL